MNKKEITEEPNDTQTATDKGVGSSELLSRLSPRKKYVHINDDILYPSVHRNNDAEWVMRYADTNIVLKERFYVAGIISAYKQLVSLPQKRRNAICKAIKEAR